MKVIGIRNSPTKVRFAIAENDTGNIKLINQHSENKLIFPKHLKETGEKLKWLYQEIESLILNNPKIDKIAIKQNENISTNYSKVKDTAFYDAIVHLVGANYGIIVNSFVYKSLGTKSKEVCSHVETITGKTDKHWDSTIADAIAVAIKELN